MKLDELLAFCIKNEASDLHISAGLPPRLRIDGELQPINMPELSHEQAYELIKTMMNENQIEKFETELELDFSFNLESAARFRVNVFHQDRGAAAVFSRNPSSNINP